MANTVVIPVKAIYTGSDVTALGELAVGDRLDPVYTGVDRYLEVANSTLLIDDRMQVANTIALYNSLYANLVSTTNVANYMAVSNTQSLVNARLGATATVTITGDVTATQTAFSGNSVSLSTTIADTGTPTGTFGSASKIPVITVNSKGQITGISNTSVAGVSDVEYFGANSTLRVSTADGSQFDASISTNDKMTVANTVALYNTLVANTLSTANATTLFNDRMQVANTIALANARLGATASVTLTGDVTGTASFSSNAVSITTQLEDDVSTARLSVNNYIDFATGLESEDVPHSPGRVYYNDEYKALTVYNDEADISLQVGQEEYVRVYNNSGSTIPNGTPCRPTGAFGESQTVAPADATTAAKARVLGVATHAIEDSTYGYLAVRGLVSGVDTSGLSAGAPVWLAANGSLQTSAPTYPYFPTQVGGCLVADASAGYLYVSPSYLTQPQSRVTGNQHVDGNLTIDGDLTVTGSQSIVSQASLSVDDSFVYLNSGDTVANTGFTGSGLNDADFTGHYTGTTSITYYVEIDGVGTGTGGVDTFKWSKDNFSTTEASTVDIDTSGVTLDNGIEITFNAATGHTSGDQWQGDVAPVNVDSGWFSNRNTGASGVGYTHMGIFFDASDGKFKVVEEYDPEPEGTIDTGHASYNTGTMVGTFEGNLTGDVTGNVTGTVSGNAGTATKLATARTIGGVSFDGTANINLPGVNTAGNQNTSGNAATATALATARTIAGQSFDGTGNISISIADLSDVTALQSAGTFSDSDTEVLTAAATNDRIIALLPRIYDVNNTQVFP
jgi:hypothetical protein